MSELEELFKSMSAEDTKKSSVSLGEVLSYIKKYWNHLWKKKWMVVAAGIICAVLGYIYVYNKTIKYSANYVFTVGGDTPTTAGLSITSLLGMGGGSMNAFSGDNVLELLKSRNMIENTLLSPCEYQGDTITFMEYLLICDSVRVKCAEGKIDASDEKQTSICDISYPYGQDRKSFTRAQDSILMIVSSGMIKENIFVSRRDKKLSYMEYLYTYPNEEFAMRFSAAHLKTVADFYTETKTSLSRKNLESFQQKADSVRRELDKTIAKSSAFYDGHRNASGSFVTAQLKKYEIDIQVLTTTYQEIEKNIKVLELDLARETPLIQIIDEPFYPLPNDKMRKLKGFIMGGFLGGFLSCLTLIAMLYLSEIKKKLETEEKE
ncbi:MAG: hypothetical protein IJJ77_07040 [Paludibacteraceae bacterium]|nr:hypothetical protein [Paludibacteraceae bacterium]